LVRRLYVKRTPAVCQQAKPAAIENLVFNWFDYIMARRKNSPCWQKAKGILERLYARSVSVCRFIAVRAW
jgi:hypothetical protein